MDRKKNKKNKEPKYGYLLFRMSLDVLCSCEHNYINYVPIKTDKQKLNKEKMIGECYIKECDWRPPGNESELSEKEKRKTLRDFRIEILSEGLTLKQARSRKIYYIKKYHSITKGFNTHKDFSGIDGFKGKGEYCIYLHISPSNKYYVGITRRKPEDRWGKNGINYSKQIKFYNAIQKYGWSNFKHKILEKGLDEDTALFLEERYIEEYNSVDNGYNVLRGFEDLNSLSVMKRFLDKA